MLSEKDIFKTKKPEPTKDEIQRYEYMYECEKGHSLRFIPKHVVPSVMSCPFCLEKGFINIELKLKGKAVKEE
jgi:hypothetical protein